MSSHQSTLELRGSSTRPAIRATDVCASIIKYTKGCSAIKDAGTALSCAPLSARRQSCDYEKLPQSSGSGDGNFVTCFFGGNKFGINLVEEDCHLVCGKIFKLRNTLENNCALRVRIMS